jgi:hypothetical protein
MLSRTSRFMDAIWASSGIGVVSLMTSGTLRLPEKGPDPFSVRVGSPGGPAPPDPKPMENLFLLMGNTFPQIFYGFNPSPKNFPPRSRPTNRRPPSRAGAMPSA